MPKPRSIFPQERYGRLTVIERSKTNPRYFICKCDCGNQKEIFSSHIKQGRTRSCGCYRKEIISALGKQTKHGLFGTKIYGVWSSMMSRCYNTNNHAYSSYGGRGIVVDEFWHKFENFYNDMGVAPKGLTLDRIDNNKGYSKENCRWATMKEQGNNKRSNVMIEYEGRVQNITQWAEELGVPRTRLYDQICRNKCEPKTVLDKLLSKS